MQMLKELTEREIRKAAATPDEAFLAEVALRILYQRKAFREVTGMKEEHYPPGDPKPPDHGPGHHGHGPKKHLPKPHGPGP